MFRIDPDKYWDWSKQKNEKLKLERSISFEEFIKAVEEGNVIGVIKNPN